MKDYDSTLARMAGNIAAGMIGVTHSNVSAARREHIADISVDIAKRIVTLCKADYAALPAENLQQ